MRRRIARFLIVCISILFCGCGSVRSTEPAAVPTPPAPARSVSEIVRELVLSYASNGDDAQAQTAALLKELSGADPDAAARWTRIMELWRRVNRDLSLHYDVLPAGLPDTDALGIVVLGFQLNPDGSMREELIGRLEVALRSAEKYPNALVICTGGGTAAFDPNATEAGKMADWLIENGLSPERVFAEESSLTTAQNAILSLALLCARCPQVTQLAIVSSDYHIATGALLFGAEAILTAATPGGETVSVVSNAAWRAPSGSLSTMFQAGALIELGGDAQTAYDIYSGTYDVHSLPPLRDGN